MCHRFKISYLNHLRTSRRAYTLIELLVATVSSSILIVGLSGSLVVASRAFDDTDSQPIAVLEANKAANCIMNEMQYATRFYEKTATAVTFEVPDRDGDGLDEKLRYAWSGVAGDPLTLEYNDSAPSTLVAAVEDLDFTYLSKSFDVIEVSATQLVQYEEMTEEKVSTKKDKIRIDIPDGTSAGDLLIAAVAVDGDRSDSLEAKNAGWNLIAVEQSNEKVTLGVWWKNASFPEQPPEFNWSGDQEAYGWIMRFTNHNVANPISDWASLATPADVTKTPTSPAVAPSGFNCMILRLCGVDKDDINEDETGLVSHITITMDDAKDVSGGAGYQHWPDQGNTGSSNFELKEEEDTIAITLAIAPDDGT